MEQLPPDLLAVLPDGSGPVAARWWSSLTDADLQRVAGLWDERLEVCFFAPQPDAAGGMDVWEQVVCPLLALRGAHLTDQARRTVSVSDRHENQ